MANHPNRVAFCPLLYLSNGGKSEDLAEFQRILNPEEELRWTQETARKYVRGKCDEAFDCGTCSILVGFTQEKKADGYQVGWECFDCLKEKRSAAAPRWLPGFYQSSKYRGPPESRVLVEPDSFLDGCTKCGFGSSLLQLVLRKT